MPNSSHSIFTAATGVTATRLALIIAFAVVLTRGGSPIVAMSLCSVSVLLDCVDGWVARRFRQQSALGEFADPVVDKVTVAILYWAIAVAAHSLWVWIAVSAIVARDVLVTAVRIQYLLRGGRLAVNPLAKTKTAAQFVVGVGLVAAGYLFEADLASSWPLVMLPLAGILVLTYFSAIRYLGGSLPRLMAAGGEDRRRSTRPDEAGSQQ